MRSASDAMHERERAAGCRAYAMPACFDDAADAVRLYALPPRLFSAKRPARRFSPADTSARADCSAPRR